MTDKQPSFSERQKRLAQAAKDLFDIADAVAFEAEQMAAAERRFSERRSKKAAR
jgi:hypothetical protein